jgi:hypothetical protein
VSVAFGSNIPLAQQSRDGLVPTTIAEIIKYCLPVHNSKYDRVSMMTLKGSNGGFQSFYERNKGSWGDVGGSPNPGPGNLYDPTRSVFFSPNENPTSAYIRWTQAANAFVFAKCSQAWNSVNAVITLSPTNTPATTVNEYPDLKTIKLGVPEVITQLDRALMEGYLTLFGTNPSVATLDKVISASYTPTKIVVNVDGPATISDNTMFTPKTAFVSPKQITGTINLYGGLVIPYHPIPNVEKKAYTSPTVILRQIHGLASILPDSGENRNWTAYSNYSNTQPLILDYNSNHKSERLQIIQNRLNGGQGGAVAEINPESNFLKFAESALSFIPGFTLINEAAAPLVKLGRSEIMKYRARKAVEKNKPKPKSTR